MGANENFVPVASPQAAILRPPGGAYPDCGRPVDTDGRREQAGRKRRIDLFEELEENQTERIALADQSITPGTRDFLDQALAS